MSSWGQESQHRRRTSERRRLKLLRNLNQYKITNPYRYIRKDHPIPDEISRQLKKVDYLSLTSINMLNLPFMYLDSAHNQIILAKMAGALEDQQKKFTTMFGQSLLDQKQVDVGESSQSDHHQANPSQGSEAVQTKEEMPVSLNIYDYGRDHIEQSLFEIEFRNMGGHEMKGIEEDQSERYKEGEEMLGEDYQKYFMN